MNSLLEPLRRIDVQKRILALLFLVGCLFLLKDLGLIFITFWFCVQILRIPTQWISKKIGNRETLALSITVTVLTLTLAFFITVLIYYGSNLFTKITSNINSTPHQPFQLKDQLSAFYLDVQQKFPVKLKNILEKLNVHRTLLQWFDEKFADPSGKLKEATEIARKISSRALEFLIGIILAIIYLLEQKSIETFMALAQGETFWGHVKRYTTFLGDAISLAFKVQVFVAFVNTFLTLPILVLLRLPYIPLFGVILFSCSLLPVVGNVISGAILVIASLIFASPFGALFFVLSTFLLHKLEAYYITPHFFSRYIKIPLLFFILSMIILEHYFGFVGLFMSFPCIYLLRRMIQDFKKSTGKK